MRAERTARAPRKTRAPTSAARSRSARSSEKGRLFVAAYVEFMHYAERLLLNASSPASHAEHGKPAEHAH
jgi:hypothetical protein